ncbi:MAG: ribosome biogenesis GTPase Der [Deltaproteobacteria bacterium]|nr:ribosome biogenesis GTPase Der [Deltaproteobacteria bacterium]
MTQPRALPIIAIVGRPNVGKSTLFNRYAGHRRALVEDTPGLTRDRIVEEVEVEGRRVLVVDTAGLEPDAEGGLSGAIQAQARTALREADAVLLVVDAQAGLLPEDERIAAELRRSDKPVGLAVNKVDHPRHAERVLEFHALGIEPMEGISAAHGIHAFEVLEALVERLPAQPEVTEELEEGALRVAVVGRPNVGKSSLVNRLAGEERVVVADEPGTTRDSIDLRLEDEFGTTVLVDTAGLRRTAKREAGGERGGAIMAVRALERAQVALLVIDAAEGATEQDARVAGLVRDRCRPAVIVANKWDRVGGEDGPDAGRVREEIRRRLRFIEDAPLIPVSAKTGAGVGRLLAEARRLHENAGRRIPTAELNRWLEDATARHQPALGQRGVTRRPIRFFYATQTSATPPSFVLFCTDPRHVKEDYRRYLENRLREAFGYQGVPVRLRLRARRERA